MTYYVQPDFPFPGNGNGNCQGQGNPFPCEPGAPIDSFGYSMLIVFLIAVVVWTKFFDKSK